MNMATVYEDQGDFEKALEYHTKALTIRLDVLKINLKTSFASF